MSVVMKGSNPIIKEAPSLDFAISLLDEAIAYETLLALKGATEARLENEILSKQKLDILPSEILEHKKRNGQKEEIERIYPQVENFIKKKRHGFSVCLQGDFHYPESLKHDNPSPKLFYYKGDIGFLESPCVSVVGSRKASKEGLKRTERVVKLLVDRNFTIVSGLAKGVDTVALKTAISLGGRVIGVIGTPIDQYYPKENKELQDNIAGRHLLVSKVPFYRYDNEPFHHRKFYFPKRNVAMSAISKGSVIIEASESSGTLSQAKATIKQKRKLFILDSCFKNHKWPFEFEKKGAIRVKREEDILDHLPQSSNHKNK